MLTSRGFWLSVLTMAPPVSWPSSLRRSVAMAPPPAEPQGENRRSNAAPPRADLRPAHSIAPALRSARGDLRVLSLRRVPTWSTRTRVAHPRLGLARRYVRARCRTSGVWIVGSISGQIKFSLPDPIEPRRSGLRRRRRQRAEPRIRGCVSGLAAAWCASTLPCSCTATLVHRRSATASTRPPLASLFCTAATMF